MQLGFYWIYVFVSLLLVVWCDFVTNLDTETGQVVFDYLLFILSGFPRWPFLFCCLPLYLSILMSLEQSFYLSNYQRNNCFSFAHYVGVMLLSVTTKSFWVVTTCLLSKAPDPQYTPSESHGSKRKTTLADITFVSCPNFIVHWTATVSWCSVSCIFNASWVIFSQGVSSKCRWECPQNTVSCGAGGLV